MLRINRVQYSLLWRRKLGRDLAFIDALGRSFHGVTQFSIHRTKYLARNLQLLRRYRTTKSTWSLSMRSSILREDLPLYVEGKRQRESSRLDSIPNDLSEVVNKVLTYIELNHEESNIRERYIRNFELARRRPFGDIDHYIPENGDESAETVSLNGVNGHSLKLNGHQLSFDDMVSDLSASNTNLRLETEYQENVSVVNGVNNSSYQNPQTSEAFGGYSLKWGDEQTKIDTNATKK